MRAITSIAASVIAGLVVALAIYSYLDFYGHICTLSRVDAERLINTEIYNQKLDVKYLSSIEFDGSEQCSYSATYKSNNVHILYLVALDPVHGIDLRKWDYERDD